MPRPEPIADSGSAPRGHKMRDAFGTEREGPNKVSGKKTHATPKPVNRADREATHRAAKRLAKSGHISEKQMAKLKA
jgi:hypothetical protein